METLVTRSPGPELAPFVEVLWYYQTDLTDMKPDRILPHGEFELIISLNGPEISSLVSGPHTRSMIVEPGKFSPILGAHFRPGGGSAILGHPAREFRDLDVPLDDVWSTRARDLHARLHGITVPEMALATLENMLTRFARTAPCLHPAIALAINDFHKEFPTRRVRDLVDEAGISQRRFIQLFTDRLGLPPKLYARIRRFQRAVNRAARAGHIDWSAIACDSGYSDQAHLIRDFQEFSGLRPREYAPRLPDHPNHVSLS